MDYLKTADEIVDVYFVTYIESCDKNNNSHSTSWRNRYIGQDGVIYILKNGNRQFFVWHPVDDDLNQLLLWELLVPVMIIILKRTIY